MARLLSKSYIEFVSLYGGVGRGVFFLMVGTDCPGPLLFIHENLPVVYVKTC